MDPATINTATFSLRDAGNALFPATVTYDPATKTATLDPQAPLTTSTLYTATLAGEGTSPRVEDLGGNTLTSDVIWSFTTGVGPTCPCTVWDDTTIPAGTVVFGSRAIITLVLNFALPLMATLPVCVFTKASLNTGTHSGNLWTSTGQLLGSAVFSNETASGWQQVDFATPVAVTAGTVYIASYFAPNGNYAVDSSYFANSGVDNWPVYLFQDGESGSNGVFTYSASSAFPISSFQASNYWVDVVFDTTAPLNVVSTTPADTANRGGSGDDGQCDLQH